MVLGLQVIEDVGLARLLTQAAFALVGVGVVLVEAVGELEDVELVAHAQEIFVGDSEVLKYQ